ncbi:MAG TPA: hypothetical protein VFF06_32840 [Polyangia bacterium]|nr:hypothetical protein [Polyangia bacterium]
MQSRKATYADLVALPDIFIGELLGGELLASRRPPFRDGHAAMMICASLNGSLRADWWIVLKPEVHLQDDVLVPDVGVGGARGFRGRRAKVTCRWRPIGCVR